MKFFLIILISLFISSCHVYSEDNQPSKNRESLTYSFGYNSSDWKMYDLNKKEITFVSGKYDRIPKIMKLDIKVHSKKEERSTIFMWYGGPDNSPSNGETPVTYQPINLVNLLNITKKDQEYKVYPPKNGTYRAWNLPTEPIAVSNINNNGSININLYQEPDTYLSVIKKDIYLIDNNNSFVEREYKTSYGIFGGLYYGMKFIKHQTLRRVLIQAYSTTDNSKINFDSGFINVSTTYE